MHATRVYNVCVRYKRRRKNMNENQNLFSVMNERRERNINIKKDLEKKGK